MRCGVVIAAIVALVAVVPAAAKGGGVAHLLVSPPTNAATGTLVTVEWTVDSSGASGKAVPFAAVGMFIRLVGHNGAARTAVASQYEPPYSARVAIPAGGITKIEVGLQGWASTPTGTRYAPDFFPIR